MEFAPPTSWRAKPITKSQMRRRQAQYAQASAMNAQNLQAESEEQKRLLEEMDDEFLKL